MRLNVSTLFCLVFSLLVAVAGFAVEPGPSTTAAPEGAGGGQAAESYCYALAHCWDGSIVTCEGDVSCVAYDSNCRTLFAGRVTCDGVTNSCPSCPLCPLEDEPCDSDSDCVSHLPSCYMCVCRFTAQEAAEPPTEGTCVCP